MRIYLRSLDKIPPRRLTSRHLHAMISGYLRKSWHEHLWNQAKFASKWHENTLKFS